MEISPRKKNIWTILPFIQEDMENEFYIYRGYMYIYMNNIYIYIYIFIATVRYPYGQLNVSRQGELLRRLIHLL